MPDVANMLWLVHNFRNAGMPEWSNGTGLGPVSLVLTKVRILLPAFNLELSLFD